ncbi:MAG: hypothetical protein JXR37_17945 [Kiritimatiellae bacterium]|nr:hypothetical protein [Kiritimatiellia bacterium]
MTGRGVLWVLVLGVGMATAGPVAAQGGPRAVFPVAHGAGVAARISVGGLWLGGAEQAAKAVFAALKRKPGPGSASSVEYAGFTNAGLGVQTTRLHFHDKKLYKLTLVYSQGDPDGYDRFNALKRGLAQRFGEPATGMGDDAATLEAADWDGLFDGQLKIEIAWEADGRTASVSYICLPVYRALVERLNGPSSR